jgi:hypothetical protein
VGENGVSHHKVSYTPKVILVKKKKIISALPCYKKREKKGYMKKEEEKRREKRSRLAPQGQHKKNTHQRAA